jgi:NAD(P)-dependent dehydrogenase (short-subunit alcohol dehydrogenase family)
MVNRRSPSPSPKQIALIIGRLGIGEEIALSFVKRDIKVAITYIKNEDDARQTADRIKSQVSHQSYLIGVRWSWLFSVQVPGHPEVKRFKFDPTSDEAAALIKTVRDKLNGLDIVVSP